MLPSVGKESLIASQESCAISTIPPQASAVDGQLSEVSRPKPARLKNRPCLLAKKLLLLREKEEIAIHVLKRKEGL